MMTSTKRNVQDYSLLASQFKSRCGDSLIYGTDGELALETAFENVFPIFPPGHNAHKASIHLRCFNHMHDDMKRKLQEMESNNADQIIKSILGTEFNGQRQGWFVEQDFPNFNKAYEKAAKGWVGD